MKSSVLVLKRESSVRVPIHVGKGALAKIPKLLGLKKGAKVFLFVDPVLASHSSVLKKRLERSGAECHEVEVPGAESSKDFARAAGFLERLSELGADRQSVFVALGGGVVGDLGGFLAGTYMRGVPWVSVPSTLLAQVDSGLGGKTGVNLPGGKNLVGLFNQPAAVVCDTGLLQGLSERDRISGLGEILKYAITFDPKFWNELRTDWKRILALDPQPTESAVLKSLEWKSRIVGKDERERKGIRELLNFGHSIAHAIEGAAGYGHFRHGEAVIWGMRIESALSHRRGRLSAKAFSEIDGFLSQIRVPEIPSDLRFADLAKYLRKDKKNQGGTLRFILLDRIGKAKGVSGIALEEVEEAIAFTGVRLKGG